MSDTGDTAGAVGTTDTVGTADTADAADDSAASASPATTDEATSLRTLHAIAIATIATVLGVAALFFIQRRAPDWDPQYARDIVERTMRFGGSYYENSVHNKGPLEPGLYHLAAMVTSFDSFWFAISAMVIGGSLLIGFACRRVVTLFDGEPWLGWAAVAIGFIHLALSGADYAGVLYSRNMTTTLLCAAFLLLTGPGAERGSTRRKAACLVGGGACLGLAVQTLQPTLLSAMVIVAIGLFVVGRTQLVVARREVPARALLAGAMLLSFLSAPVWYLLRGSWGPFWDGWWVYGRYMSSALGRGVTEQMGLGWHQFYVYSQTHAPAHLCVVGFVMLGAARWPQLGRAQRRLQVLLPLWWLAGWGEVILTQRYSSHYFVVTTVPLMLLCAGLAAHVVAMLRAGGASVADRHLVPYLLVLMSLVWTGFGPLRSGVEAASSFQGVHHMAMQREQGRDGTARGVQAVLDLVSRPDDPMLTWTNYPWPFLDFRRVSATRFIWKSFLMGEIYLGPTSPEYVLPGSWDLWADDVRATRPRTFLTDATFPIPPETPAAALLETDFEPMFTTPTLSLALRNDVAEELRDRSGAESMEFSPDGGWTVAGTTVRYDGAADGASALALGDLRCRRVDAVLASGTGLSFHFANAAGVTENLELALVDERAVARSSNVTFTDFEAPLGASRTVSLVVGRTVAALLVDDKVVAAVNLLSSTRVSLTSSGESLTLEQVGAGATPGGGEC